MTRIERKYFISWRSKQVYTRGGRRSWSKEDADDAEREEMASETGLVMGKNEIESSEGRWVLISVEAPHLHPG